MAAVNTHALDMRSIFDLCGYVPHKGQRPLHRSTARHRWGAMGRRLGKSHAGGHEATVEALRAEDMAQYLLDTGKRNEVWIVGPEYTDAEKEFRVLWNDARRLELPLDKPGSYYNDHGDMILSLWGGALRIQGKSAKYPSTLVGEALTGVILSEAAKLKESVWTKYIRPTLADVRGWSIAWSTPEGKNWFYRNWQKGQDEDNSDWESWRMPSWYNDIIFPGGKDDPEIIDMCADMSEQKALQEIHASFTDFVGRVFKDFDEEIHVRKVPYDPKLPIYLCCDFGWRNPFVMLAVQVDVWDNVRVIGEYRVTERDINDIADDLAGYSMFTNAVMLFPDPADPSSAQILGKKLKVPVNNDTGGEKKFRLEYIRSHLKRIPEHLDDDHPEKQPRLTFDRSCTGTIYEMSEYRYPETKDEARPEKEEPMDFDDHGPEALGRFFRGYYGPPVGPETRGRGRVSGSSLSGKSRRAA
jgi:hypothetical protein